MQVSIKWAAKTAAVAVLVAVMGPAAFAQAQGSSAPAPAPGVAAGVKPNEAARPQGGETAATTPANSVVADLAKLQTEVALLRAQTERATAQAELDKAMGVNRANAGGRGSAQLPIVTSIYGRDGMLSASIRLDQGGKLTVREGDHISGGYKVARIDSREVTFSRQGRNYPVAPTADFAGGIGPGEGGLMLAPPLPMGAMGGATRR
ncbi:hypothetical protein PIN31009_05287 [Pandoraea iniqua]|uniref:type IV pilus biogenesis protein PilP n=1 Tax=Pandoraea iniqua TaxID=2508288 RepID=UPI0012420A8A|nr:hypothetical protein PIN31009_05287 [Pandoraea iniqua]